MDLGILDLRKATELIDHHECAQRGHNCVKVSLTASRRKVHPEPSHQPIKGLLRAVSGRLNSGNAFFLAMGRHCVQTILSEPIHVGPTSGDISGLSRQSGVSGLLEAFSELRLRLARVGMRSTPGLAVVLLGSAGVCWCLLVTGFGSCPRDAPGGISSMLS